MDANAQTNFAATEGCSMKASREKTFDECKESEQIVRLREQVIATQRELHDVRTSLNALLAHQHAANGNVLVTLSPHGGLVYDGYQERRPDIPYRLR